MKTRILGWTGLELSVIGLGTWAAGGTGWKFAWGPQEDKDTIKTVSAAVDAGINWIDTAAVYGLGHSEEVVGKAVKGIRDKVIIATKCSRVWNKDGSELSGNLKKDNVKRECENSLKRLDTDIIDLYQVHWPQPEEDIEEGWEAIAELIKEGKVRFGGVSNFSSAQMERIAPINRIASLQPPYNMLRRDVEDDRLPYCEKNNIGVICYSPMERGLLTGKVTKEWVKNLPDSDHRKRDFRFNEQLEENLKKADALGKAAGDAGITLAQLALAWVLKGRGVTAAIAGARRPQQIKETAAAGDIELDEGIMKKINKILN